MTTDSQRLRLLSRHERRLELMVPAELGVLRGLSLFSGVPEKARDKVIEKARKYFHVLDVARGETILRDGEYSDSAYYIIRGSVEIEFSRASAEGGRPAPLVRGGAHVGREARPGARPGVDAMLGRAPATSDATRRELGADEIFGELSALSRYPVSATVRAASDARLLRVRLPGLRMLMAASHEFKAFLDTRYRERSLAQHLRQVGLFASVDPAHLERLRDRAELVSYDPGQVIVQEGAAADAFYLVRGGFVKVGVKAGASEIAVTYLRKGDYAGEAALLLDESWPFSLQALDHVELVKLAKPEFQDLVARPPALEDAFWSESVARLKARGAAARNPVNSEYLQMAMETGLIHGESVLLIDLSTCTRCDDCVRGCASAHGGQPVFAREGQKYRNWLVPTACYQCTDPVCMMDCPTGAIARDMGTLEVTINPATCIGCGNCADRCPWGNIVMVDGDESRPDGRPVEVAAKCDLCVTRPEGPACVQMCPHGSAVRISFKDMERVTATLK